MWMIDFLRILFFQQGSQCSFVFPCSCQTELFVLIFGYYPTPTKNLGTLTIKNVTPRNVIGCVAVLFRSRVSVSFIFSALSRVPARSHFSHLNFSLSTRAQPPPNPPGLIPGHYLFSPWICRYTTINIYEVPALCCLLPVSPVRCPSAQQRLQRRWWNRGDRSDGELAVYTSKQNQKYHFFRFRKAAVMNRSEARKKPPM